MKKILNQFRAFTLIACFLALTAFFSGCVRLTGGAGVWKQGADDEEPVSHSASFDTDRLVRPSQGS